MRPQRRLFAHGEDGRGLVVASTLAAAVAAGTVIVVWMAGENGSNGDGQTSAQNPGASVPNQVAEFIVPRTRRRIESDSGDNTTMTDEEHRFWDLIDSDPRGAAVLVTRTDSVAQWDLWLPAVMESWVTDAPREAISWLEMLPRGDFRTTASQEFFIAAAEKNPADAASWIADHARSGRPLPDGTAAFVGAWAEQSPEDALAWVERLGDTAPPKVVGSLAYALAATDPEASKDWLTSLNDPALVAVAAPNMAIAWGADHPEAAIVWIRGQSDIATATREHIALGVLQSWAFDHPATAAGWVKMQPDGAFKETAKAFLGEALGDDHPVEGLAWANSITDPAKRSDTVANIYDSWLATDTASAKIRLLDDLTKVPVGDPLRESLLDLLYHHDPEFRRHVLSRAAE